MNLNPSQFDLLKRKRRVFRILMILWCGLVLSGFPIFIYLEHSGQLIKRVSARMSLCYDVFSKAEVYRDHNNRVFIYSNWLYQANLTECTIHSVEDRGLVQLPFGYALFKGGKPRIINTLDVMSRNRSFNSYRVEEKLIEFMDLKDQTITVTWQ